MTGGHLEPVRLAEYDEGLLDAAAAAKVATHVASCAECAATLARLAQVRATLRAAPAELSAPAAVAARIDAALAEERQSAMWESTPRLATVHPLRRRLPQLLAAAATVAAIGLAGYAAVTLPGAGGDESAGGGVAADADAEELEEGAIGPNESLTGGDETAAEAPAPASGAERTALTEQISAIAAAAVSQAPADRRDQTAADCGQRLATELGRRIVAAQPTDVEAPGSVLIVVDTDTVGEVQGWVLPSCDALAGDALSQLTVRLD